MLGYGEVPERPKGVDCKSIGYAFAGSNPALATITLPGLYMVSHIRLQEAMSFEAYLFFAILAK
jgi:hypothetical protein